MLQKTFVHLPGIGLSTEKKLWDRGIGSWADLQRFAPTYFNGGRLKTVQDELEKTFKAWEAKDLFYFHQTLPHTELWRFLPRFLDDVAYLDIETDGLRLPPQSRSTTITFYFRGEVLQAHELREKRRLVERMAAEARIFCTYFGDVFDLPFLRKEFNLLLRTATLDLCFWLKRLGFNGGLKKVEKEFPNIRARQSQDIGGLDAVRLWKWHEKGLPGALETLLSYNAEDTIVLETLLVNAYNLEIARRPHLGLKALGYQEQVKPPTSVDLSVYERLRARAASAVSSRW